MQTALHHPIVEAAEPEDSEYGDVAYCRVATYTSLVAIAGGHIEEIRYSGHIGELWYPEPAILKIRENTARVLAVVEPYLRLEFSDSSCILFSTEMSSKYQPNLLYGRIFMVGIGAFRVFGI